MFIKIGKFNVNDLNIKTSNTSIPKFSRHYVTNSLDNKLHWKLLQMIA